MYVLGFLMMCAVPRAEAAADRLEQHRPPKIQASVEVPVVREWRWIDLSDQQAGERSARPAADVQNPQRRPLAAVKDETWERSV